MHKEFIVLSLYEVHMASASIMIDGEVIAATHEERFTRLKNDEGFPLLAAEYCLKSAGVRPEEVDAVAMVNSMFYKDTVASILFKRMSQFSVAEWIEENEKYWKPKLVDGKEVGSYFDVMGGWARVCPEHHYDVRNIDFTDTSLNVGRHFNEIRRVTVEKLLNIPRNKVKFVPHYLCHHYHAYYSGIIRGSDVVVVHAEGSGEDYNQAVSRPTAQGLKVIAGTDACDLGRLYQWITVLLGMKPYSHEYKLMGLAPHANPQEVRRSFEVFKNVFHLAPEKLAIEYKEKPKDLYFHFRDAFHGHRFDGIAGALQKLVEDHLTAWIDLVVHKTGCDRVVFGGGVAMNVKANMAISQLTSIRDFAVPLSPADEGNVFGAGYKLTEDRLLATGRNPESIPPLQSPFLGRTYDHHEVDSAVKAAYAKGYKVTDNVGIKNVADLLAKGIVVARCQGRSEFGQRALGNRSILANPSIVGTADNINKQIKYRDFWMPFAPSILDTHADIYLSKCNVTWAPHMTIAFQSRPERASEITEALHQSDHTARPQILERSCNSEYYDLIREFEISTGIGALLNTSFNLHGEPIVDTPADAIHVFDNSNLDAIWIGDVILTRATICS